MEGAVLSCIPQLLKATTLSHSYALCAREGNHILDNFEDRGITIMLGDQHLPALITIESTSCVITMRYSNATMTDLYEYLMLPSLRSSGEFHSKERNGFTDILQAALHERMEIKLVVASGTSWLTDGASGYVDSMCGLK